MIAIYGGNGNMGKRYEAVLRYLNRPFHIIDEHNKDEQLHSRVEGIIVATPTHTHFDVLMDVRKYDLPVLCEKPFSKNLNEVATIVDAYEGRNLSMVYNYRHMGVDADRSGATIYNYFKHGTDGLAWDCIQLIGLANREIHLYETSPMWECFINGQQLDISKIDGSYISMIQSWLGGAEQDLMNIYETHVKTSEYAEKFK